MRILTDSELAALEAYHNDRLTAEQRADLEQALRNDQEFRQAALEWLGLAAAEQTLREQKMAATLEQWASRQPPAQPLSAWSRLPLWSRVVILASLAGILWWLGRQWLSPAGSAPDKRGQQIAADFFRPERVPGFTMGMPDSAAVSPARRAYAFKKYDEAIPLLKKEWEQAAPRDSALLLYLGCAYLATERPDEAITTLQILVDHPEMGGKARWYLAIAELKAGRVDQARTLLLPLADDPGSAFQPDARALLDALNFSR